MNATSCMVDSSFLSDFINLDDLRDFMLELFSEISLPRPVLSFLKGMNLLWTVLSAGLSVVASV